MDLKTTEGLCQDHRLPIEGIFYIKEEKIPFREYCAKCIAIMKSSDLFHRISSQKIVNLRDFATILKGKMEFSAHKEKITTSLPDLVDKTLDEVYTFYFENFRQQDLDYNTFEASNFIDRASYPILSRFSTKRQNKIINRIRSEMEANFKAETQKVVKEDYGIFLKEVQTELDTLVPDLNDPNKEWTDFKSKLENIKRLQQGRGFKFPLITHVEEARITNLINDYKDKVLEDLSKRFIEANKINIQIKIKEGINYAIEGMLRRSKQKELEREGSELQVTEIVEEEKSPGKNPAEKQMQIQTEDKEKEEERKMKEGAVRISLLGTNYTENFAAIRAKQLKRISQILMNQLQNLLLDFLMQELRTLFWALFRPEINTWDQLLMGSMQTYEVIPRVKKATLLSFIITKREALKTPIKNIVEEEIKAQICEESALCISCCLVNGYKTIDLKNDIAEKSLGFFSYYFDSETCLGFLNHFRQRIEKQYRGFSQMTSFRKIKAMPIVHCDLKDFYKRALSEIEERRYFKRMKPKVCVKITFGAQRFQARSARKLRKMTYSLRFVVVYSDLLARENKIPTLKRFCSFEKMTFVDET